MNPTDRVRREAVARLCEAQAAGLLSIEVFEERYALLRDAETAAIMQAIIADLPTDPGLLAAPRPVTPPEAVGDDEEEAYPVQRVDTPVPLGAPASIRIPSILGSTDRAGFWIVPEHLEVLVILGELKLDFRDAQFTSETTVIDLSVTLGSVTITIPPGTQVENECREVLASSKHSKPRRFRGEFSDDLLVLRGGLFMSELVIKEAPPTGTPRKRRSLGSWLGLGAGEDAAP